MYWKITLLVFHLYYNIRKIVLEILIRTRFLLVIYLYCRGTGASSFIMYSALNLLSPKLLVVKQHNHIITSCTSMPKIVQLKILSCFSINEFITNIVKENNIGLDSKIIFTNTMWILLLCVSVLLFINSIIYRLL